MIKVAAAFAILLLSSSAMGQVPVVANAAPATALRTGLSVPMRIMTDLTTKGKNLRVGQRVPLEVAENVMMNGQIVIPSGTPGMGELTAIRNKGMWGKSGAIDGRVLYIRVGDRQIRMSGAFNDKGKTGTGGVVAAAVLIPVAGFFTTGTSAQLPVGTPVTGFLDEDVPVTFAAGGAPAPLQAIAVPAGTAAPATAALSGARQ